MPSSVVDRVVYDPEKKVLTVVFQSGKVYAYKGVPEGVFLSFRSARSKGRYLNNYIKSKYEFEELASRATGKLWV